MKAAACYEAVRPLVVEDLTVSGPGDGEVKVRVGAGDGAQPGTTSAPRAKKIHKTFYKKEPARLQLELVKLQHWVEAKRLKIVIVFEGRDAAG